MSASGTTTPYLYGYLQLDGVDPLFQHYNGDGTDPGQPNGGAVSGTPINGAPGQLPACDFTATSTTIPACHVNAIWQAGDSFPHLRDGTYRAWSLLRGLCDTADPHCLTADDSKGLQALISAAQNDIINNTAVPDFLPFSQITKIRSHFQAGANTGQATGPAGDNSPEAGGDVGGCILNLGDSETGCRQ
jgi:hypothetical protein